MNPPPRPNLERLRQPIQWRPALQIGDSHYRVPKPVLRAIIESARGVKRP